VPAPGVTVDRDSNAPRSGTHCLRIGFEKAHGNYFNFSQRLALQRETGYVVSAWMKTEGLPTDGPVGLEVIHPKGHRRFCAAASAEETKDSGWSRVTVRFETPSDTPYLVLRLRRFGGPEIITGALWTDDVEISESRIHP